MWGDLAAFQMLKDTPYALLNMYGGPRGNCVTSNAFGRRSGCTTTLIYMHWLLNMSVLVKTYYSAGASSASEQTTFRARMHSVHVVRLENKPSRAALYGVADIPRGGQGLAYTYQHRRVDGLPTEITL
jgi:hypothetical protein